jgi:hypothetical protein
MTHAFKSTLLFLALFAAARPEKECFCSKRIDGYSLSAVQIDFLDFKKKHSFETVLETLVARYNAVTKATRTKKLKLPTLALLGHGKSPRFVFKRKVSLDQQAPGTTHKIGNPDPATQEALTFQDVREFKRVYRLGNAKFFVYYHPNQQHNRLNWNTEWTTRERSFDRKFRSPIARRGKGAKRRRIHLRPKDAATRLEALSTSQLMTGDLGSLPLVHRYTFSHYMAQQFEFDVCVNFAIFVNKMLRRHFNKLTERDRLTGTPVTSINYFLTDERGECKDLSKSYNVWVPEKVTRIPSDRLKLILKKAALRKPRAGRGILKDTFKLYKKYLLTVKALGNPEVRPLPKAPLDKRPQRKKRVFVVKNRVKNPTKLPGINEEESADETDKEPIPGLLELPTPRLDLNKRPSEPEKIRGKDPVFDAPLVDKQRPGVQGKPLEPKISSGGNVPTKERQEPKVFNPEAPKFIPSGAGKPSKTDKKFNPPLGNFDPATFFKPEERLKIREKIINQKFKSDEEIRPVRQPLLDDQPALTRQSVGPGILFPGTKKGTTVRNPTVTSGPSVLTQSMVHLPKNDPIDLGDGEDEEREGPVVILKKTPPTTPFKFFGKTPKEQPTSVPKNDVSRPGDLQGKKGDSPQHHPTFQAKVIVKDPLENTPGVVKMSEVREPTVKFFEDGLAKDREPQNLRLNPGLLRQPAKRDAPVFFRPLGRFVVRPSPSQINSFLQSVNKLPQDDKWTTANLNPSKIFLKSAQTPIKLREVTPGRFVLSHPRPQPGQTPLTLAEEPRDDANGNLKPDSDPDLSDSATNVSGMVESSLGGLPRFKPVIILKDVSLDKGKLGSFLDDLKTGSIEEPDVNPVIIPTKHNIEVNNLGPDAGDLETSLDKKTDVSVYLPEVELVSEDLVSPRRPKLDDSRHEGELSPYGLPRDKPVQFFDPLGGKSKNTLDVPRDKLNEFPERLPTLSKPTGGRHSRNPEVFVLPSFTRVDFEDQPDEDESLEHDPYFDQPREEPLSDDLQPERQPLKVDVPKDTLEDPQFKTPTRVGKKVPLTNAPSKTDPRLALTGLLTHTTAGSLQSAYKLTPETLLDAADLEDIPDLRKTFKVPTVFSPQGDSKLPSQGLGQSPERLGEEKPGSDPLFKKADPLVKPNAPFQSVPKVWDPNNPGSRVVNIGFNPEEFIAKTKKPALQNDPSGLLFVKPPALEPRRSPRGPSQENLIERINAAIQADTTGLLNPSVDPTLSGDQSRDTPLTLHKKTPFSPVQFLKDRENAGKLRLPEGRAGKLTLFSPSDVMVRRPVPNSEPQSPRKEIVIPPTQTYMKFMNYFFKNSANEHEAYSWFKSFGDAEFEPPVSEELVDSKLDDALVFSKGEVVSKWGYLTGDPDDEADFGNLFTDMRPTIDTLQPREEPRPEDGREKVGLESQGKKGGAVRPGVQLRPLDITKADVTRDISGLDWNDLTFDDNLDFPDQPLMPGVQLPKVDKSGSRPEKTPGVKQEDLVPTNDRPTGHLADPNKIGLPKGEKLSPAKKTEPGQEPLDKDLAEGLLEEEEGMQPTKQQVLTPEKDSPSHLGATKQPQEKPEQPKVVVKPEGKTAQNGPRVRVGVNAHDVTINTSVDQSIAGFELDQTFGDKIRVDASTKKGVPRVKAEVNAHDVTVNTSVDQTVGGFELDKSYPDRFDTPAELLQSFRKEARRVRRYVGLLKRSESAASAEASLSGCDIELGDFTDHVSAVHLPDDEEVDTENILGELRLEEEGPQQSASQRSKLAGEVFEDLVREEAMRQDIKETALLEHLVQGGEGKPQPARNGEDDSEGGEQPRITLSGVGGSGQGEEDGLTPTELELPASWKLQTQSEEEILGDLAAIEADGVLVVGPAEGARLVFDSAADDFLDLDLIDHRGNPLRKLNPHPVRVYKAHRLEFIRRERFVRNLMRTLEALVEGGLTSDEAPRMLVFSDLTVQFSTVALSHEVVLTSLVTNPYRLVRSRIDEIAEKYMVRVKARLEYEVDERQLRIQIQNTDELTGISEELLTEVLKLHVQKFREDNPTISVDKVEEVGERPRVKI